ncbi:hypothetical protein AWB79_01306 [Caballeronia hypogeia]|uniref:Uncharacterized protein n=1 Tax=Caballeronia hypogeia TaxID=1777140 RepID=A0A157ZSU3_9BURK|nr:hypothetical protein AWB79_01306 [Caballeronia hypogeia]
MPRLRRNFLFQTKLRMKTFRVGGVSMKRAGRNARLPSYVGGTNPPPIGYQTVATGILPIFACHSAGPVLWTEMPLESTATVTGMSWTSNS